MTIATNSSHDSNGYKTLFGYGHLRGKFLHSDMSSGKLYIDHFVRPEFLAELREQLITNQDTLTQTPNTQLQRNLAPASRQCLWELQSGIMLRALENITDQINLLPDTHCKSTRLLFPSDTDMPLMQWHDASTKLEVAMVLVILLEQGDAMLFTTAEAFSATPISSVALQVTYWKNNRTMHGNGTGANE